MHSMPTAFLLTSLAELTLMRSAPNWGWTFERKVADDLIFLTTDCEIVRTLRSAFRASCLPYGAKIYLGPSHQECPGLQELVLRVTVGAFDVHHWPPRGKIR